MNKTTLLISMSLITVTTYANAQLPPPSAILPPETFLLGHQTGSAGTAYVKELMSGRDNNPARLFDEPTPSASIKFGSADNRTLPNLSVVYGQGTFSFSTKDNWRGQIIGVQSGGSREMMPGIKLFYREDDTGGQIAFRRGRLQAGAGLSYFVTRTNLSIPGLGNFNLTSHPDRLGGRIGGLYKITKQVDVEAVYDNYAEKVRLHAPALFGPLAESNSAFESRKYSVGGVYHHHYGDVNLFVTKVNVTNGEAFKLDKRYLHGGVSVPVRNGISVQTGFYDRFGSLGLTYPLDHGEISIGLTNRYKALNKDAKTALYAETKIKF